jgi:hypothetical protein
LDLRSLIDLGGFLGKGQDTKDRTKITRKSRGLIAKRPYLLPFDRADRGKSGEAAALVAGGAGAPASWGLGWRVQGLEKIVGSSETRSPRSENGRKLAGGGPPRRPTATVAGELDSSEVRALRGWESRRRRLGHCGRLGRGLYRARRKEAGGSGLDSWPCPP